MNVLRNPTVLLLVLVILLMSAMSACTSKSTPVSNPSPGSEIRGPSVTEKATQESLRDKSLKSAAQERKVTIYGSDGGSVRQNIVDGFKKRYGLEVEWTSGSPAEVTNKIITERRAGLYVADIAMFGPTTMNDTLVGLDVFQKMDNFLILPDVKDTLQWFEGKFPWFNSEHTVIAHSGLLVRLLAINNQIIKQGEITKFEDLLDPKWKGKMSINDPTFSGTGQTGFGMLGQYIMGWDFMLKLAQQEPFVTRDYRLQVDWLAKGKYPIAIAARSEGIVEYLKAGAPISYLIIPKTSYSSAGSAGLAVLKNNPHPAATTLYINWFLSNEGQTTYSKARGYQSMRQDVPTDHLDSNILRDPKTIYPSSSSPEAMALREEWDRKSKEIFGPLINK